MAGGSLDLGELYARLAVDYSDLHNAELAARRFGDNTRRELGSIDKAAKSLQSTGKTLSTYVTAPLVGAGAAAVKFSNDFDKAVREVNSLLDPKDQNFDGLKNEIRGVSLMLGTDLVDSAKAAYEALGAGVPKDNLISFLTVAGKAAIGGVTDMKTVVDGLTTVTNSWGASAGDAQKIADEMFVAVKYGKVTFGELAASMSTVGGLGPELGVTFREVAATSALMTAQGGKQAEVMTNMRAAMSALMSPNEEMAKVLKAAGIESTRASVKQKGLAKTYDLIREAANKNNLSLEKSVGSVQALDYVFKVTGANGEKFITSLDQVSKASGAADLAFKELDKARGFDKLVNNLKALATIIGDQILPIITPMVEGLANWLAQANELDPGLVRVGVAVAAVAAAVGPLLLGLGAVLGVMAPIVTSAGGMSAALASVTAVAGPVGLAFAAIAGSAYLLYKNWNEVKSFVSNFVTSIITYFKDWQTQNSEVIANLSSAWSGFVAAASSLWQTLSTIISNFVSTSVASLDQMLAPIGGLQGAWQLFKDGVGTSLTEVTKFLTDFLLSVTTVFNELNNSLKTGDWSFFKEMATAALEAVGYSFIMLGVKINEGLSKLPGLFKETFSQIITYIKTIDWKQVGLDAMAGLAIGIANGLNGAIDAAKSVGKGMIDATEDVLGIESPSKVFMGIGAYIMEGLGIGIRENTSSAVAEMIKAGDTLNAVAKEKLSQKSFGSFESNLMLDTGMGEGGVNYELELAKEQAYYDQSKAMLDQAQALKLSSVTSYAAMREAIEQKHTNAVIGVQRQALQSTVQSLDASLSSLEQFGQKQSGIYKAIFAVSKAFAIAEAMLALQQNIANASKVGFPYNIPFIAGAVAQGASIISNVSAMAGAFNNGGYIPTGQVGMVGEKGPEFVSGPANVFSTQNTKEALNGKGGGSGTKVNISVMNFGNSKIEVEESGSDREKQFTIFCDRVKDSIAADAIRGDGKVDKAFSTAFKLGRTGS